MDASTIAAIVSAVIAAGGLLIAYLEHQDKRRKGRTEAEKIAAQRERLRTASAAARSGAESANLIVQRAKEPDVSILELQNVARVMRGTLSLLAEQLDNHERQLTAWEYGQLFTSD